MSCSGWAGGGFIQGYNAQNVTSSDGLIIATTLTQDTDMAWFTPMMDAAAGAAGLIAAHRPGAGPGGIGLVLADAGYCSQANLTGAGPDRLIATGKRRDLPEGGRGGGAGWGGDAIAEMRGKLKTGAGRAAYRQRGHIAETPHGYIKHTLGLRQLSVRGKNKAAAEWIFTAALHNLLKAITSGHLTHQTLATPAS
jgi:hypothetical protein